MKAKIFKEIIKDIPDDDEISCKEFIWKIKGDLDE